MPREVVAQKHDTNGLVINEIVTKQMKAKQIMNDVQKKLSKSVPLTKDKIQTEHPDYPKKTDDMSKEEHQEAVKEYFKLKGLKDFEDFDDDEKKMIVDECTVNLIGPTILSKKYNTMTFVITKFVRNAGLSVTPDDLSMYPDFPKKSDDMSQEEYQIIIKKYWKSKKNRRELERKKAAKLAAKSAPPSVQE